MKKLGWLLAGSIVAYSILIVNNREESKIKPDSFFDLQEAEESPKFKEYKKEYLKTLYFADEGIDVDSIRNKQRALKQLSLLGNDPNSFANGKLSGEWIERGPLNEAGDIQEVDFDPITNDIYALSTVGHLFKGNLDKRPFELLSDQYNLNTNFFEHVKLPDGGDRLLAIFGEGVDAKMVRFSDDSGVTWTIPKGLYFYDHYGSPKAIFEMSDGTIFYFVHTWDASTWASSYELYKSENQGYTYSKVFEIDYADNSGSNVRICKYPKTDSLFVYDLNLKTRTVIGQTQNGTQISPTLSMTGVDFSNNQFHATGRTKGSFPIHYIYSAGKIYNSNDGLDWSLMGDAKMISGGTMTPWGKGKSFITNPNNNELYSGGFQFNKTTFENELLWNEQYNYWWTYYDKNLSNRKDYMHVDITGIEYFEKSDGTPFFIVLNHAGIHCSYDNMNTTENLGMQNLNCVTLYDHATASDGTIYFGAQDKGTFSVNSELVNEVSLVESTNQTTGDGMRELFFNDGKSYMGCLQNGFIICKPDKSDNNGYKSWSMPGDHIPGWINPMENNPDPSAKSCYVAGGNIYGGEGSYLIEMNVSFNEDGSNFQWLPNQLDYDFRANSNSGKGIIKALSAAESDFNRLYVATSDGSFFTSFDKGGTWTRSSNNLPSGFMPWDIVVSKTNPDLVIVCGTGWSNCGVLISDNAGVTFSELITNYTSATYFDIALSDDEKYLFSATSEGPKLYDFEDETWYDLSTENTPLVEYRSVEYLSNNKIARFGTYGRGLWDLNLDSQITSSQDVSKIEIILYPNPVEDKLNIRSDNVIDNIEILDSKGQLVLKSSNTDQFDLKSQPPGIYTVKVQSGNSSISKVFVKK